MAIRRRTGKYWEQRSIERLTAAERDSLKHLNQIFSVYDDARRRTVRSVQEMYAAYYTSKGWDKEALNAIAPSGDIQRFLADMRRAGLHTELPDNYRGRMSRLELINAQLWGEVKKVSQRHTAIETAAHAETISKSYYRTIYDVSKGIGSTPDFNRLNDSTLNRILSAKFAGRNYSDRVWGNTDTLAAQIKEKLAAAIATGQAPAKTIREIQDRFGVSKYNARRLVQTETNFFENSAEIESYKQMGIEEYVFVATLDGRTSKICRDHDGKRYKVSDFAMGVNVPPLHPFCRSTIRPYIGKEYEPKTRIARDTNGRNVYVSNMSYGEWEKLFVHDIEGMAGAENVDDVSKGIVATAFGAAFDSKSLWGIDGDLVSDTVNRTETLLNEYPSVQQWVKDQGGLLIRAGDLQRGVMASTQRFKPVITLSRAYFQNRDALAKTVGKGVKLGHSMPATDHLGYVFNHEFGHLVENYLLRDRNVDAAANKIRRDIIGIAKRKYKLTDSEVVDLISKYGMHNSREFFAEAFANLHSGQPNRLGKAMGEYLKGVMK